MRHPFLNVVENLGSTLSWWHSRWPSSTPLPRPRRRRRRREPKSKTKRNLRKIKKLVLVLPRKTPTRKQSKVLSNSVQCCVILQANQRYLLSASFSVSPFRPKSDILKDPPSEVNSIQSANATTKTSETNHTSRYRKLD